MHWRLVTEVKWVMNDDKLRRSLCWLAENRVLREYQVLEADGFGVQVMLGAKPIWAHLGKEPLDRTTPMKLVGLFSFINPSALTKSSGKSFYIRQEAESGTLVNSVKFNGVVLSMFESFIEMVAGFEGPEGRLSSTIVIDLGDARAELCIGAYAGSPPITSLCIGEPLQGTATPIFTPAHWLGEENMRGILD